jgi:hypothetical protein
MTVLVYLVSESQPQCPIFGNSLLGSLTRARIQIDGWNRAPLDGVLTGTLQSGDGAVGENLLLSG